MLTATIDAVRNAVQQALSRERREWGRELTLDAFCGRLLQHLVTHGARDAATRLEKARQSRQGRARMTTIAACIEIASLGGSDPAVSITADRDKPDATRDFLFRKARHSVIEETRRKMRGIWTSTPDPPTRKLSRPRPDAVELSTPKLAIFLGITRQAARTRLAHAIEAGAVIDVGAAQPLRSRTAPKLLAPGVVSWSAATAKRTRRGAFPDHHVVQDAMRSRQEQETVPTQPPRPQLVLTTGSPGEGGAAPSATKQPSSD